MSDIARDLDDEITTTQAQDHADVTHGRHLAPLRVRVRQGADSVSAYGFEWGPLVVERVASDDRIGWVLIVRPKDAYKPQVEIRVSPAGRVWDVRTVECDHVEQIVWTSQERP